MVRIPAGRPGGGMGSHLELGIIPRSRAHPEGAIRHSCSAYGSILTLGTRMRAEFGARRFAAGIPFLSSPYAIGRARRFT